MQIAELKSTADQLKKKETSSNMQADVSKA
jgi:hypothetical protein